MMHERYTNPFLVGIYVISVHHTAFGDLGEKFLLRIFFSLSEKSSLCVVTVYGLTQHALMPISLMYLVTVLSAVLKPFL